MDRVKKNPPEGEFFDDGLPGGLLATCLFLGLLISINFKYVCSAVSSSIFSNQSY
jgi:hypothetical protein